MENFRSKVYAYIVTEAIKSRALLMIVQYISNAIIPDHKPKVFTFSRKKEHNGAADQVVLHLLGGFLRWDAQYFVHISIHGYSYENSLAFFPFLPVLVRLISNVFTQFLPFLNIYALILLLYIILNSIVFVLAAVTLYKLTYLIFNDSLIGYKTVLLFCYNPASIFFIAPYTECLYSLISFQVMLNCLLLYQKYEKTDFKWSLTYGKIILLIWCSTLTRSNGILNSGFLIYVLICLMKNKLTLQNQLQTKTICIIKYANIITISSILSVIPFCLYQLYCYKMFCFDFPISIPKNVLEYGRNHKLVFPGEFSLHNQSWCNTQIPLAYSYVQEHYWNVGFLKYFEIKQIPNFLLAAPILISLLKYVRLYISKNSWKLYEIFSLNGLVPKAKRNCSAFNPVLRVFVIHIAVLLVFCIFMIHIQVSTRMLCSASPMLYWYCSQYIKKISIEKLDHSFFCSYSSATELFIKCYFFGYFLAGTILFCNFLPWT